MPSQPMAEVFGYPIDNLGAVAKEARRGKLCPYHNRVPECTKDRLLDPLGVCSVYEGTDVAITCPIRFRQDWTITADAAAFFFPPGTRYRRVTEVRLAGSDDRSVGNIDVVLVALDGDGQIVDFGALEVQAVYISGNIRNTFSSYMADPERWSASAWTGADVRPDYLSSRKRLALQLLYKGAILRAWGKKLAVAVHSGFYSKLPPLPSVPRDEADMAWFLYALPLDPATNARTLSLQRVVYTSSLVALQRITQSEAGPIATFEARLRQKLRQGGIATPLSTPVPAIPAPIDPEVI